MSLVCNKLRSLALPVCAMICAGMLAACTSTPPEDDEAIPAKSMARNASSAATSAASSTSSATATSAATSSTAKPQGSEPAEAGVNTAATPAPVMVPPEALVKFNKAMLPVYAGKLDEGARQLEQLAAAYPALSVPYINEGLMYLKANQFEDAERVLKLALQRDPNSAIANNYLGVAERNLGKFKEAEAAYKAAITADDNYAVAHLNLAVLYDLYLQQPEDAVQQYDRYQQLVPNPDPKIVNWIREIHNRVGAAKKPAATETSSATQPGATP